MTEQEMQNALLNLAYEMTSSMSTANMCICTMDLDSDEHLFDIAQYLKALIYKAREDSK